MVAQRKYLAQELDYVLSRVAAGWKFETIAAAFKQDFASHWADRIFTKKQVQYIRNTYKRPPGTIQPYDGPIPTFPPSSPSIPQNNQADLQAETQTAPTMVQQRVENGNMGMVASATPHTFNSMNQPSLLPEPSGLYSNTMEDMIDPLLISNTGKLSEATTIAHHPVYQAPMAAQSAPIPSNYAPFSGYASHLATDPEHLTPSLGNTLLNSPAPRRVLSGEHANQLLREPLLGLGYTSYGESHAKSDSAQNQFPLAGLDDTHGGDLKATPPLQVPPGCSINSSTHTDHSGWWYQGHHDSWCRIPHNHRHDYDGGVHFRSYDSYTQNIYTEQNDHVTGFLQGLCAQLQQQQQQQTRNGAPHTAEHEAVCLCLHQACEDARHLAQDLVDACNLPLGHDLRQAPLRPPHPAVITLLESLNDRLPEGFVYDPFTQRVVRYEVPRVAGASLPLRNEVAEESGSC